jgi:hypothetical protein
MAGERWGVHFMPKQWTKRDLVAVPATVPADLRAA